MQKTKVFSVAGYLFRTLKAINWNYLMRVSTCVFTLILLAGNLLIASPGISQGNENTKLDLEARNTVLKEVFKIIEAKADVVIMYELTQNAFNEKININVENATVGEILNMLLQGKKFQWTIRHNIIRIDDASDTTATPAEHLSTPLLSPPPPITVRGRIVNEKNEPVLASVTVKGTKKGITTNADGIFILENIANDAVLIISGINIETREINIDNQEEITINVTTKIANEEEVTVSTGYWTTTKVKSTGSTAKVTSKYIERQPVTSPLLALQGRMPGVDISPTNGVPGSSVKIQIRGINSLRMDGNANIPLYVVDGVPIDSRALIPISTALVGNGFDPLSTINPSNIESIEVLKDADATAIYGSRGANGVILVTTKSSTKGEKTNLEIGFYKGVGEVSRRMKLLDTKSYLEMRREAFDNDGTIPGSLFPDNDLIEWDTSRYTDWQKELIGGTADILDAQVGISGGGATTSFRISGGFHKEGSVFPNDFGYHKLTAGINVNHLSNNQKFRGTMSVNYGVDKNALFEDGDVLNNALTLAPNAPAVFTPTGDLNWENSTWINPLAALRRTYDITNNNLIANSNLSYKLFKGVSVKVNLGYTKLDGAEVAKYPLSAYNPVLIQYNTGARTEGLNKRQSWIVEPQMMLTQNFSKGELNIVTGSTWQSSAYQSQSFFGEGYTSDLLLGNMKAANSLIFTRNEKNEYKYAALFARLGYNWNNKYFVNLSGRRDGSSRFGPNNRFANFGALGTAWVFSNEKFIQDNLRFLSFGKLRASYGTTGNDQIGDYKFYDTYLLASNKYQNTPILYPRALYNASFAWEITRKLEVALELAIVNDRISAEINWYRNRSSNQLVEYTLPFTAGFQSVLANLNAKVQNSGLEVIIRGDNIKSDHFEWTTSVNFSLPRNKLVNFPALQNSPYASLYSIGQPLSINKLYRFHGVNEETGIYEFEDMNNDGIVNELDRLQDINFGRIWYAGINNSFIYKSFELDFLIQLSNQDARYYNYSQPGVQANQPVEVMDRWKNDKKASSIQKFSQDISGDAAVQYNRFLNSTGIMASGSFARLKTVSLFYHIPELLCNKLKLQALKIYFQGQNLITLTNYKGLDPETGFALPPLRMITTGIQVKF